MGAVAEDDEAEIPIHEVIVARLKRDRDAARADARRLQVERDEWELRARAAEREAAVQTERAARAEGKTKAAEEELDRIRAGVEAELRTRIKCAEESAGSSGQSLMLSSVTLIAVMMFVVTPTVACALIQAVAAALAPLGKEGRRA